MIKGPIVLIDDDYDDLDIIKEGLLSLPIKNKIVVFDNALEALAFFDTTDEIPFIILCDINMPEVDGLELRKKILRNPRLQNKTVPFLFLSTASDHPSIKNAFNLCIQGYFIKPSSMEGVKNMLAAIINYWRISGK